jgi:hypothetical protein
MTANTAKTRKAKGSRLEHYVAQRIVDILGIDAKRMPLSGALQGFKSDIYTLLPISVECKNSETWSVHKWWKQCKTDCTNDKIPVLVMSRNRQKEPLVMLEFEDMLFILELAMQNGWVGKVKKKGQS